jgi:peptidoglycan/LPS O-acetylase OafA/YrhL
METEKSTRENGRTARSSAVVATLAALLLLAVSIVGQIAAGADYPAVPPGLVIPLVAAGLLFWRANRWTAGLALVIGVFIGVGAFVTPDTGDHLSSGDTALVVSTVAELVALAGLVVTGAAATLRTGART